MQKNRMIKTSKYISIILVWLLLLASNYAQKSQCIFSGTVQINGVSPPAGTQVNLLKSDMTFIRTANYNYENGSFGVNAFNTDGLNDGDSVHFQVISDKTYNVKTYGDPPIFMGKVLPYPSEIFIMTLFYLDAPLLLFPENQTINIPTNIELSWQNVPKAEKYHIEVAKDNAFSNILFNNSELQLTSQTISNLDYESTYYWRVSASNISGESDWSQIWSFTTIVEKPGVPILLLPENQSVNLATEVVLSWQNASKAEKYHIEVAKDYAFSNIIFNNSELQLTSQTISNLDYESTYYWRVSASNISGESDWSQIWSFTTIVEKPGVPILLLPENQSVNLATEVVLSWQNVPKAEKYHIEVAKDYAFSNIIFNNSELQLTSQTISNLDYESTYYWRVSASNISGESDWSQIWSFTTIVSAPEIPVLLFPTNELANVGLALQLIWRKSSKATEYSVKVAYDDNFQYTIISQEGITDSIYQLNNLQDGRKLWWKVKAKNNASESEYSESWWFITMLNAPENLQIADSSTSYIKIKWEDKSLNEDGFIVERGLATSQAEFEEIATLGKDSTEYIEKIPLKNNRYQYRVKAFNSLINSAYSNLVYITVTSLDEPISGIPLEYKLLQNYPNPFNPSTIIKYELPEQSNVKIEIFNMIGQSVSVLVNQDKVTGYHETTWNATNLPSGIYLISIKANGLNSKKNFTQVKKALLLK